ncbi:hypothetical protein lerEdw1_004567 [Lerista edwardsae]|nr:hypothetical protein lerEdw1_004567 [Lerista edwardsae]
MSAIQALQLWCKQKCEGYRDVHITNMTTSFRDGLAFCAILHRHRPELIDFSSLSKENVYENNQLAFQVAEKELGIPALLDAEDMVSLKVPDRLSILTYVSQYYNYFHGRSPIGGMAGIKRSPSGPSEEPAGKKAVPKAVTPAPAKPAPGRLLPEPTADPILQGRRLPKENAPVTARPVLADSGNTRSSSCAVCGGHVHLVQRLLVDGKLYHRNCFRCKTCSSTLQSGNYKAGSELGSLVCKKHEQPKRAPDSSPVHARALAGERKPVGAAPTSGSYLKAVEPKKPVQEPLKTPPVFKGSNTVKAAAWEPSDLGSRRSGAVVASRWPDPAEQKPDRREAAATSPPASNWTASSAKTQQARERFFRTEIRPSSPLADKAERVEVPVSPPSPAQAASKTPSPAINTSGTVSGSSEKDKARSFLTRALPGGSPPSSSQPGNFRRTPPSLLTVQSTVEKSGKPSPASKELDNKVDPATATQKAPPFSIRPPDSGCKVDIKVTKVGSGSSVEEKSESPAEWRSRLRPVATKASNQSEAKTSQKSVVTHEVKTDITPSVTQKGVKPSLPSASPLIQSTGPPADQPPKRKRLVPNLDISNDWQKPRQQWADIPASQKKEERGLPRHSSIPEEGRTRVAPVKPSAPTIYQNLPKNQVTSPSKLHRDHIPEVEIQKEQQQIEKDLDELELKGVDMEKQLRGCEGDETEDALMVEWFKLIHEKQLLLRRESELMHKLNQQKLEEQQWDIETELRNLMNKSVSFVEITGVVDGLIFCAESLKSPKEKAREEELFQSYLAAVEGRNKIVENLDEDRLREREEDEMLAEMIQRFGADLPRNSQETEKKKTKSGWFQKLKPKNKTQE